MTGIELLQMGLAASLSAGLGVGAATWRARRRAAEALHQSQEVAARLRSEAERIRTAAAFANQRAAALEKAVADGTDARARLETAAESLRQELAQAKQAVEAEQQAGRTRDSNLRRTLAERDARLAALQAEQQLLQADQRQGRERIAVLTRENDGASGRGDALAKDLAMACAALASFGVKSLTPAEPLEASKRAETRAALVALWSDQDADGVALVDGRGLALGGVGADATVDQLAAIAAHVAQAEPALREALEGPVREFSSVRGDSGQHLLRLGDSGVFLGLGGRGRPATLAMRMTALSLVGAPPEEHRRPGRLASPTPAVASRKAQEIQAILVDWTGRWSAEGAALVNAEGKVLAATSVEGGRRLANVRAALRPLYLRAVRDDQPLRQLELTASGGSDQSLAIRTLGNRSNSLALVVLSTPQVPREAVDELVDSLRWVALQGGDGSVLAAEAA